MSLAELLWSLFNGAKNLQEKINHRYKGTASEGKLILTSNSDDQRIDWWNDYREETKEYVINLFRLYRVRLFDSNNRLILEEP